MDTYSQPVRPKRRHLALEEKRRIAEETLVEGASVARIALAHGLNTNLVFNWRRLYQKGLLGGQDAAKLLPVTVTAESSPAEATGVRDAACRSRSWSEGTIQIQLQRAQVRVEGNVDAGLVRVVLECLRR
jgi:transposase